jgi:adenosylhomocysteine nucleosidase
MTPHESITNKNEARNHAVVGVQVGQVGGSVNVTIQGPADLRRELTQLRADVTAARDGLALDQETFEAAQEVLAQAGEHAADGSPSGRRKLIAALKQLGGLVSGVADLASKVAAVITAVHGM